MELSTGQIMWTRIIGIVGGMGPRAHIEFESRLLTCAGLRSGTDGIEQRYPSWILASIPATPDRTKAILGNGPSPVPDILRSLDILASADFAVMPCITAHAFFDEIAARSSMPLVNLVEETLEYAASRTAVLSAQPKVGLLATTGTLRSGIFQKAALRGPGVRIVTPHDLDAATGSVWQESVVMGAIYGRDSGRADLGGGLKSGSHETPDIRERMIADLEGLLNEYAARDIGVVIGACTELSLLASDLHTEVELVDPLTVVSEVVLDVASGVRSIDTLRRLTRDSHNHREAYGVADSTPT